MCAFVSIQIERKQNFKKLHLTLDLNRFKILLNNDMLSKSFLLHFPTILSQFLPPLKGTANMQSVSDVSDLKSISLFLGHLTLLW